MTTALPDTDVEQIIDEDAVTAALAGATEPDAARLEDILAKARERHGLDRQEVAELVQVTRPDHMEELFEAAAEVKQRIYGNRVVLFAPLYVSNECVGNCLYCAFRRDNKLEQRRTLTTPEITREVEWLIEQCN